MDVDFYDILDETILTTQFNNWFNNQPELWLFDTV